jgi:hypothetical protein
MREVPVFIGVDNPDRVTTSLGGTILVLLLPAPQLARKAVRNSVVTLAGRGASLDSSKEKEVRNPQAESIKCAYGDE